MPQSFVTHGACIAFRQNGRGSTLAKCVQGNLALKVAMDEGTPVRVCRAAGTAERAGVTYRQYAYEGLYLIQDMTLCVSVAACGLLCAA